MYNMEELKSILKYKLRQYSHFDNLENQENVFIIDSLRGLFLEIDSEMVTICFSGFEQCFYSFNYESTIEYATAVSDYIRMLFTHPIRVTKLYRGNQLVKSYICIEVKSGWKKIASNSLFSLGCFFKKASKVYEEFYQQQ